MMGLEHIPDYDSDPIRLYWQIHALKGQVAELEREREQIGNLLWRMRYLLLKALVGLGEEAADLGRLSDQELMVCFERALRRDWRFSRCPNAERLKCRPSAMQTTRDGEPVHCEDCGWDIRD